MNEEVERMATSRCSMHGCGVRADPGIQNGCAECIQTGVKACSPLHHGLIHSALVTSTSTSSSVRHAIEDLPRRTTQHLVGTAGDTYHTLMESHVVHTVKAVIAKYRTDKSRYDREVMDLSMNATAWEGKLGGGRLGIEWRGIFWEHTLLAAEYIGHMATRNAESANATVGKLFVNMSKVVAFWARQGVPGDELQKRWKIHLECTVAYVTQINKRDGTGGLSQQFWAEADRCVALGRALGSMLDATSDTRR